MYKCKYGDSLNLCYICRQLAIDVIGLLVVFLLKNFYTFQAETKTDKTKQKPSVGQPSLDLAVVATRRRKKFCIVYDRAETQTVRRGRDVVRGVGGGCVRQVTAVVGRRLSKVGQVGQKVRQMATAGCCGGL